MEKKILKNKTNFIVQFNNCTDYYLQEEDAEQRKAYLKELCSVVSANTIEQKWKLLIESGIFHDANGKVIEITEKSVTIEDDY